MSGKPVLHLSYEQRNEIIFLQSSDFVKRAITDYGTDYLTTNAEQG